MLIVSTARLIPTTVNMMVLEDKTGRYYYVHRGLYDQAAVLEHRWGDNRDSLRKLIGGYTERTCSDYFYANVPKPIGILGYFLSVIEGDEDFGEDIETMCGIIHVLSAYNLAGLIKLDIALRRSFRFSLSVKEEYQLSWDKFFQESLPYDRVQNLFQPEQVNLPTATPAKTNYAVDDKEYDPADDPILKLWDETERKHSNETESEPEEPAKQPEIADDPLAFLKGLGKKK